MLSFIILCPLFDSPKFGYKLEGETHSRFMWSKVSKLELWESENENEDPHKPHHFVSLEKTHRFVS
ncbi:hypothetical protein ACS0TY_030709 [Phlomoides rotata]